MEANEDALELWWNSITQWRMGFSGPVGLDYAALGKIARWMGIPLDGILFRKIQALEAEFLGNLYGPSTSSGRSKKKKCAHPDACRMCRKNCDQRTEEQG